MQTFITQMDFYPAARTLDPKRLGNQYYREGMTLLRGGWPNHPASRMWRGHEKALTAYLLACQAALQERGRWYGRTAVEIRRIRKSLPDTGWPPWLDDRFCAAHRSNLLRKNPGWYGRFGWEEPDDLLYVWQVK